MSKSIRSYPESERPLIVRRRLASQTKGLGYWAATTFPNKRSPINRDEAAIKLSAVGKVIISES